MEKMSEVCSLINLKYTKETKCVDAWSCTNLKLPEPGGPLCPFQGGARFARNNPRAQPALARLYKIDVIIKAHKLVPIELSRFVRKHNFRGLIYYINF